MKNSLQEFAATGAEGAPAEEQKDERAAIGGAIPGPPLLPTSSRINISSTSMPRITLDKSNALSSTKTTPSSAGRAGAPGGSWGAQTGLAPPPGDFSKEVEQEAGGVSSRLHHQLTDPGEPPASQLGRGAGAAVAPSTGRFSTRRFEDSAGGSKTTLAPFTNSLMPVAVHQKKEEFDNSPHVPRHLAGQLPTISSTSYQQRFNKEGAVPPPRKGKTGPAASLIIDTASGANKFGAMGKGMITSFGIAGHMAAVLKGGKSTPQQGLFPPRRTSPPPPAEELPPPPPIKPPPRQPTEDDGIRETIRELREQVLYQFHHYDEHFKTICYLLTMSSNKPSNSTMDILCTRIFYPHKQWTYYAHQLRGLPTS